MQSLDTLYAEDAVSVEALAMPGTSRESSGLAAVKAKCAWWIDNHDIHTVTVTGPWPHDERFVVGFRFDITHKPSGIRTLLDEVGLYVVRDGKIVREEFFYSAGV